MPDVRRGHQLSDMPRASSASGPRSAAFLGLAVASAAYAADAAVRVAVVGDLVLSPSALRGMGSYPFHFFTGLDARFGLGVLIAALAASASLSPLRHLPLLAVVSIFTFGASHLVSVGLPYLFLRGILPLPAILRTPPTDLSVNPWLRVLVFSALLPLAVSLSFLLAPRLIRAFRQTHSPA